MGTTTFTPLFALSGFGPLRLSTDISDHGNAAFMTASTAPTAPAAAYATVGGQTLGDLTGPVRYRLAAASDGNGIKTPTGQTSAPQRSYVLKFLSSKTGRFTALPENGELIIGHLPESGLVLPKEGVSRKHAKITVSGGQIFVEDLGSTGGTCVNSRKITQRTLLNEGDRLLIGGTILKLEAKEGGESAEGSTSVVRTEDSGRLTVPPPPSGKKPDSQPPRMSGRIDVIPLPDLLQLLSGSQKSGVLSISSDLGVGQVRLRNGRVYSCSISGSPDAHPRKAFFRLLRWTEGTFELLPPDDSAVGTEMNDSIDSLLMNGMCEMDEINRLPLENLKPGSKISPNLDAGRLRDLTPDELDVFQTVLSQKTLEGVLDHFPGTDLQALTGLAELVKKGFVVVG